MSSKGRRGESPDSQPGSQEKSSAPKADERRGNKRPRPIESLNPIDETGRRSRGTDDKDVRGRSSTTLQDQQLRIQGVLEGIGIEGTRTNPVNLDRSDNNDRAELLRRMMSSTSSQQYPAFQSMTGGSTAQISPYSLPTRGTTPLDLSSPRQGPSDSPLTGLSHEQLINRLLQQGRYSESTASNPMGFGGYNLEAQQNALRNTLLGGQFAVSSSQQRGIGNDSSLASRLAEVQQQQELQRLLHARLRGAVMNSLSTSLGGPYQRDNAGLQEHLLESLSTSSVPHQQRVNLLAAMHQPSSSIRQLQNFTEGVDNGQLRPPQGDPHRSAIPSINPGLSSIFNNLRRQSSRIEDRLPTTSSLSDTNVLLSELQRLRQQSGGHPSNETTTARLLNLMNTAPVSRTDHHIPEGRDLSMASSQKDSMTNPVEPTEKVPKGSETSRTATGTKTAADDNIPMPEMPVMDSDGFPVDLPAILYTPADVQRLSAHQIFLRQQIEAFRASESDVSIHKRGRNKPIVLNQVGIRCRYCAHIPVEKRQKGSTYFPASCSGIYQACQNMNTMHLQCGLCAEMPENVRQRFSYLLVVKGVSLGAGRPYWERSANDIGLVDTPDGIRFFRDTPSGLPVGGGRRSDDEEETVEEAAV